MSEQEAFKQAIWNIPSRTPTTSDLLQFWSAALEWAKQGQEPRYWVHDFGDEDGGPEFFDHPTGSDCSGCLPLYLHPAPAQPVRLSDEEVERNWQFLHDEEGNAPNQHDFANAIMDAMLAKGAGNPAVVQQLVDAIQAAIDCGMVPISSVSDGGAAKHSIQVRVADQLRAALKAAKGE